MIKLRKLPDDYLEQLFDLLQKSYSLKEIAKELNVSYSHIRRIMCDMYSRYEVDNIRGLVAKKDQVLSDNLNNSDLD
jgi:Mn-dependent DtxR family transcriptional regulator